MLTISCLLVSSAFALPESRAAFDETGRYSFRLEKKKDFKKHRKNKKHKDPIAALKEARKKVEEMKKQGKISKEKADELIKQIDEKIRKIEEFNRLPLEQRKEMLIEHYKNKIAEKVNQGKLTQEHADELIRNFTEKVKEWDGKSFIEFHSKK